MSIEPPSSGGPTGPPSGPLSGPSQPAAGPPPGGPRRPWWRSAPRIALATTTVVAVTAVALLLTRSGGDSDKKSGGEVILQAATRPGPDPFTESTAAHSSAPPAATAPSQAPANTLRSVDGGSAGLYGGSKDVSACDVERQIRALSAAPAKNTAFASVAGVQPGQVPSYLRALTPVQLRTDTRVTNHGFRDGAATSYQSVLQAGTAVLIDGYGVPRVRCACGNPLTRAEAQSGTPRPTGDSWAGYRPANVVVVAPSITIVNIFVLYDHHDHGWIARPRGDSGHGDRPTTPPSPTPTVTPTLTPTPTPTLTPSPSASTSPSPTSPSPSPSPSPSVSPSTSTSPSESSSVSSMSPSPSPESSPPVSSSAGLPSESPPLSLSPSASLSPVEITPLAPLTASPSPTGLRSPSPSPSPGELPASPGV